MSAEGLIALNDRVADVPDAIPRLRQFILDLAVRGKLVGQDVHEASASELIREIGMEKKKLGIKVVPFPISKTDAPFDLPSGWSWSRIDEICSKTGLGSTLRGGEEVYKANGTPFMRSQNIYNDGLRQHHPHSPPRALLHEALSPARLAELETA